MRAAQVIAPQRVEMVELRDPVPAPFEVLIAPRAVGICGTDRHIFRGEYEATYPVVPGHEFSGEVVAVGDRVERFRPGDRVTADPNISCNRCPACQRNEQNQCENHAAVGVTRDGAFAEYVVLPEGNVFPISELGFNAAALIEPLACYVFRRDLTIVGSFAVSKTFPESIALIRSGAIEVEPLISHRLPLERFGDALAIAGNDPDRMKVQVVP